MIAHAPRHVTCRQGVKNDHIFGIPMATLSFHCATFMGLRLRLRAVYSWKFYTGAFLAENFQVRFGPIFDFGGIFQGLDINFEFSTPKKHTVA